MLIFMKSFGMLVESHMVVFNFHSVSRKVTSKCKQYIVYNVQYNQTYIS